MALLSLINKTPSYNLVDKNLIGIVEEDNYAALELVGGEKIQDILIRDNDKICLAVISDRLGQRFFKIGLKKSEAFFHPYGLYINSIEEITKDNIRSEAYL